MASALASKSASEAQVVINPELKRRREHNRRKQKRRRQRGWTRLRKILDRITPLVDKNIESGSLSMVQTCNIIPKWNWSLLPQSIDPKHGVTMNRGARRGQRKRQQVEVCCLHVIGALPSYFFIFNE